MKRTPILSTATIALLGALAISNSGAQLVVTTIEDRNPETGDPAPPGSLRQHVANIAPGGTITFDPSLPVKTITLNGRLQIAKSMTIDATGVGRITLRGGAVDVYDNPELGEYYATPSPVIGVSAGVTNVVLNSLVITEGAVFNTAAKVGIGISNRGEMVLNDSVVSNHGFETDFFDNDNFTGGSAAGIYNTGQMVLNRCQISGNHAGDGAGFVVDDGSAGGGAGGIYNSGTMTLSSCLVSGNCAGNGFGEAPGHDDPFRPPDPITGMPGGSGGGIVNTGELTLENCQVSNNSAGIGSRYGGPAGDGGGILNRGTLVIRGSHIHSNKTRDGRDHTGDPDFFYSGGQGPAGGDGGGIWSTSGSVTIEDSTIEGNTTGSGGASDGIERLGGRGGWGAGIGLSGGDLTVRRSIFANNHTGDGNTAGLGSAFDNGGELETYPGGTGGIGGAGAGIYSTVPVTLVDCLVRDNTTGDGGSGGTVEGRGGSGGSGAGIYSTGGATVTGCTFTGNRTGSGGRGGDALPGTAAGDGGRGGGGGGVYVGGIADVAITNSTLNGNQTGIGGAGGSGDNGGDPGLGGEGGGIGAGGIDLVLNHCTIIGNSSAGEGGGIGPRVARLELKNSVISSNAATLQSPDIGGSVDLSVGVNLVGDAAGLIGLNATDLIGVDPSLAPLGDYGGATPTLLPLPGSPLVDAAADSDQATDQRGLTRATADIGAAEFQTGDNALVWVLDPDSDGSPFGVELAVGTDPLVPDRGSLANLQVAMDAGAELTFGRNPSAPAGTTWVVKRSADLESFDEIYRFDGAAETLAAGVSSVLGAEQIVVMDSDPPAGTAVYRLEALHAP